MEPGLLLNIDAQEQQELEELDRQRVAIKAKYLEMRRAQMRSIIAEREEREPLNPAPARRSIRDGSVSFTASMVDDEPTNK